MEQKQPVDIPTGCMAHFLGVRISAKFHWGSRSSEDCWMSLGATDDHSLCGENSLWISQAEEAASIGICYCRRGREMPVGVSKEGIRKLSPWGWRRVFWEEMLKERVATKPRGTEIRLNKQEGGDGQRWRRRERWFQHKHLSDLEGTYVSVSRASKPISENGAPVSGAISFRKQRKKLFFCGGHI